MSETHPRHLHRRPVPGACARILLRERRPARGVPRVGRLDAPEPGPPHRDRLPAARPGAPGPGSSVPADAARRQREGPHPRPGRALAPCGARKPARRCVPRTAPTSSSRRPGWPPPRARPRRPSRAPPAPPPSAPPHPTCTKDTRPSPDELARRAATRGRARGSEASSEVEAFALRSRADLAFPAVFRLRRASATNQGQRCAPRRGVDGAYRHRIGRGRR